MSLIQINWYTLTRHKQDNTEAPERQCLYVICAKLLIIRFI